MFARIWGTRGSYPVARADVLRYGGNTTCVEVRAENRCIILDAGTGLRLLGEALMREPGAPRQLDLLITHTHWDHIIGFPFFAPIYAAGWRLNIYGLSRTQASLRATIASALGDPLFPVGLEDLRAEVHVYEIHVGSAFELGPVRVRTAQANHPYRALAYRLEGDAETLVFVPDTGPFHTVLFGDERIEWTGAPGAGNGAETRALAEMRARVIELAQGADWLLYDAQFTDEEYARFPHWGHGTASQAREIAEAAGARELLLFHHDPRRSDAELDAIVAAQRAAARPGLAVSAAAEGRLLSKGGAAMKAQFWGVRGYVPTPGAAFLRYGGNTCCVSLHGAGGELVVLDSGTGFCELGATLMAGDFRDGRGELTMLITHTYWDHFLGLPFPGIVHVPGNHLRIYGPDSARGSLEMIYDNMLAPVYSPVFGLAHIAATHSFHPVPTEPFQVGQLTVRGMPLSQGDHSPIWAYRVEEAGRALVYITDARYTDDAIWREAVRFARDAEVLIHSAPYLRGEAVRDDGHSRVEDAIELALEAKVRRLYLYHHAPTRTDDDLDALVARCRGELAAGGQRLDLDAAREGEAVEV